MSKFFNSGETFRVSFPDGEYVDIKQEFSQEDMDYITSKMMQASVATNGKERAETSVQMVFGKQATLERAIISWSFSDEGKSIPVTPENISNLRTKYRTVILTEIDRLTKASGEFLKN